jgi:hypothetical protein
VVPGLLGRHPSLCECRAGALEQPLCCVPQRVGAPCPNWLLWRALCAWPCRAYPPPPHTHTS